MAGVETEAKAATDTPHIDGETATAAAASEPAAKRIRVEDGGDASAPSPNAGAHDAEEKPVAEEAIKRDPVKVGYKSFTTGSECYKYFHQIITKYRKNQNLNDYEFHMIMELIRIGHPEAERKLANKVDAVQIRDVFTGGIPSSCFHLLHSNGTVEDVSYRKCVANLFPEMKDLVSNQGVGKNSGGGSRRGRGGRGGGRGRGRGGRRS